MAVGSVDEFLEMTDAQQALTAGTVAAARQKEIEMLAKALGGKK